MKIATIGTSKITEQFISALRFGTDIILEGVYSRDGQRAEAFREKHGANRAFSDLSVLAKAPEIDAVYIASPNAFHEDQSRLFLLNGKHVFCEKPMTVSLRAQKELDAIARERGLIYLEAIMTLHSPGFRVLREQLGKLGRIRNANFSYFQLSSKYPAYIRGENPNIFNPEMKAGALMDLGVYPIYLSAALFGRPNTIISSAQFLDSGADASGSAVLGYDGLTVTVSYSKVAQGYSPSEIYGDTGTLRIASTSQLNGIDLFTKDRIVHLVSQSMTRDEVMAAEALCFEKSVKEGESESYRFFKQTAEIVREITDVIREQNHFPF